jgi:hypothetical protein
MAGTSTTTAVNPLLWPLLFDGSIHVLLLTGQVILLAWTVSSLASETPKRKWLRCIVISLVMNGLFAVLTPEDSPGSILLGLSVMVGAGAVLIWKSDFLPFGKAVMATLLCGSASVALSFHVVRELELIVPHRPTLNHTLATLVDDRLRRGTRNPALAPSTGLVSALKRSATSSRVGQGGTPFTTAGQMTALRPEAEGKFNPASVVAGGPINPLPDEPGKQSPSPVTAGKPALTAGPPPASAAPPATNRPDNAADPFLSGMDDASFPAGLGPDMRAQWKRARETIRISATGRSARGAFVMIGQRMIHEGEIHQFRLTGTNYSFRLTQVKGTWSCRWEPVLDEVPAKGPETVFF